MDFTALFDFVERFGPEVSGRSAAQPPEDQATKFAKFVKGKVEEQERHDLCELLRQNPSWIGWFASQIRADGKDEPKAD